MSDREIPTVLAFDRKASTYDTHAHVQRDTAAWVAEWLPSARPDVSCLEFGSGTGNFTRHLARCFRDLEASDQAEAMVAAGRESIPSARWTQRNAWAPHGEPGTRDFLASCSVLQWAPDPVDVLKRWRTLLKPGGETLSGIYIAPSLPEFARLLPERRPVHWRTEAEWKGFFCAAGFQNVRIETCTREYIYPGARALMRQLHGTGAVLVGDPLPISQVRSLINRYEKTYSRDGGVVATWTFCRVSATG